MHFEILVEDLSGKKMLEHLVPKIIDINKHSFSIKAYNGCGTLPKNLNRVVDPAKRVLLNRLPALLAGYGKSYEKANYAYAVIVVCDLDDRDKAVFLSELNHVLNSCAVVPNARFCLAVEEGEAWLLGDWYAIKKAYPSANLNFFKKYKNDSICGTWEVLADIVYPGGVSGLKNSQVSVGKIKCEWAENISPLMDINNNKSESFNFF